VVYLAGNVPITAVSAKLAPQRNIELGAVLDAVNLPTDKEASLATLAHDSASYSSRRN